MQQVGWVLQGLPLSLSGVRKIMERMDWGDAEDFVSFGTVSADQIDDSRYYILIAPQNVVGSTIMTNLHDMVGTVDLLAPAAGLWHFQHQH